MTESIYCELRKKQNEKAEKRKRRRQYPKLAAVLGQMKTRCYNRNSPSFRYYGRFGIEICQEWLDDSDAFIRWAIRSGYREGLTIDRIDPLGNYSPQNCQWLTRPENTLKSHRDLGHQMSD